MVREDLKPSDILTRESFINAIRVNSAIGGSTNAPIHLNGLARHVGVELSIDDWQKYGEEIPLLVNLQPAGEYLGEDYYHAGGVPAVVDQLMGAGADPRGRHDGERPHHRGELPRRGDRRREGDPALSTGRCAERAGFRVLQGNLFHSAIMKMSVISPEFRDRYLTNPDDPEAFEGKAIVFDGPEDYHQRIDDPALAIDDEHRSCSCAGRGRSAIPVPRRSSTCGRPTICIRKGVHSLPCIGDGRQSGTSGSPSILNASPEAAAGGGLALLRTGDRVRIDLRKGTADILISDEELAGAPQGTGGCRRIRLSRRTRRPGRNSSGRSSGRWRPGRCSSRRSNTSASPRRRASRATTTDRWHRAGLRNSMARPVRGRGRALRASPGFRRGTGPIAS